MKIKKTRMLLLSTCVAVSAFSFYKAKLNQSKLSPLQVANIEALAGIEDLTDGERPPEWWDFFNNYEVEEWIPVNSSNCKNGSITIKGVTITVSDCDNYSYVVYHHCYDGYERDECTSSHAHTYI